MSWLTEISRESYMSIEKQSGKAVTPAFPKAQFHCRFLIVPINSNLTISLSASAPPGRRLCYMMHVENKEEIT
jgi:hypothetical protein